MRDAGPGSERDPARASDPAAEIPARLAAVRRRIAAACERSGRRPSEVVLIGASKLQPPSRMLAAWRAGLEVFGENRVQEALAKSRELPGEIEWHLIGPLQSNKVKPALDLFRVIHSVDRLKIARALDREARRRGLTLPVFVEVNLGEESTKHGFPPSEIAALVAPLSRLAGLRPVGLMAIPPFEDDPEAARRWFRDLRRLRDQWAEGTPRADFPGHLSMGMSHDFEVAVEEGATHVRVGTALFGPRGGEVEEEAPG